MGLTSHDPPIKAKHPSIRWKEKAPTSLFALPGKGPFGFQE